MKKILCFGDSNTYGFNPSDFKRYNINERWSGILKNKFDSQFNVIEKGCNNRCGFNYNIDINLNGFECLKKEIQNNYDIVILQIGINDTQIQYQTNESIIKSGLEKLINAIKSKNTDTKIIILCPSIINDCILNSYFNTLFGKDSIELSKKYPEIYERVCNETNSNFIDLNKIAQTSNIDGLHYDIENHIKIAQYLSKLLLQDILE